jgi:hypothetical protein
MKPTLFVVIRGQVKASTLNFSLERLLEFGAQLKRNNPNCEVYIKDAKGIVHPIE